MTSPPQTLAALLVSPIGIVRSGFHDLAQCPPSAWSSRCTSRIEVLERYRPGLLGLTPGVLLFVLWQSTGSRRDVLRTTLASGEETGVFAQRSHHRPNPIALSMARVTDVGDGFVEVEGIECMDGTPVFDIKLAVRSEEGLWI